MTALHRYHGRVATGEQVFGGAVAQVPRVLHVIWDRIGAPEFVTDVLGDARPFYAKFLQTCGDLCLEDLTDVDFGDAQMTVCIPLDFVQWRKVARIDIQDDTLGNHRNAIASPITEALDDRAHERIHNRFEP